MNMKKILLSLLCCLGLVAGAQAQDTFRKGTNALSLGIGVGTQSSVALPPLSATYEFSAADGIFDYGSIGIGGQLEYIGYSAGGIRASEFFLGARGTFHYEFVDRLDTYAGLQAGLRNVSGNLYPGTTNFVFVGVAGARYFFNDTLAVFGELGTHLSTFKVGVSFNL